LGEPNAKNALLKNYIGDFPEIFRDGPGHLGAPTLKFSEWDINFYGSYGGKTTKKLNFFAFFAVFLP